MLRQSQARSQRLPAKEASAKPKFRNIPEPTRERPIAPNAPEMNLEILGPQVLRQHGELPL